MRKALPGQCPLVAPQHDCYWLFTTHTFTLRFPAVTAVLAAPV